MNPSQIARRILKSVKICGIRGGIKSQAAEAISNICQGAKESPTDSTDEHGYWVRRLFPQIARMNTVTGIHKICENLWNLWENKSQAAEAISNICQGAKESPTDSTDEHGYWVRRLFPQIARMNTVTGIHKICENLWNLWENKSQAAEGISHRYRRLTQILGAKESPTDSTDEHGFWDI